MSLDGHVEPIGAEAATHAPRRATADVSRYSEAPHSRPAAITRRAAVRWATLGAVAVMLATACGAKTEIVYVDPPGLHGAYQPFIQTTDPRIDRNGHHTVPPSVAIGPEAEGHKLDSLLPIATSHSRLVDTAHRAKLNKPFYFSFEDHPIQMSPTDQPGARADCSPGVERAPAWGAAEVAGLRGEASRRGCEAGRGQPDDARSLQPRDQSGDAGTC